MLAMQKLDLVEINMGIAPTLSTLQNQGMYGNQVKLEIKEMFGIYQPSHLRERTLLLCQKHLLNLASLPDLGGGDTVLDPFTGSGTVGVVALREGRKFIGTELNPEYAAMAVERIGLGAEIG